MERSVSGRTRKTTATRTRVAPTAGGTEGAIVTASATGTAATVTFATDANDKTFADKAAASGVAEVKLSKLAMDKGDSPEVKQFIEEKIPAFIPAGFNS